MRRRLKLPPLTHLIELTVMGSSRQRVQELAERLAQQLRATRGKAARNILGPAPHRIARLRRTYRMCVAVKTNRVESTVAHLRTILQPGRRFGGLPVLVDVDPL